MNLTDCKSDDCKALAELLGVESKHDTDPNNCHKCNKCGQYNANGYLAVCPFTDHPEVLSWRVRDRMVELGEPVI